MPTELNFNVKKAVIGHLKEHPGSTAKEIWNALRDTIPPKRHSAALYSMKNTGLVIESFEVDAKYPRYFINPEADPDELEEPILVYNRKRGEQTNHRIGCIEQAILDALAGGEYTYVADIRKTMPEVPASYIRKMLRRLEEINKVEHIGTGKKDTQWRLLKE